MRLWRSQVVRSVVILLSVVSAHCGGGADEALDTSDPRPSPGPEALPAPEPATPSPSETTGAATNSTTTSAHSTATSTESTTGPTTATMITGTTTTTARTPAADRSAKKSKTAWEVDPHGPEGPVLPQVGGCEDIVVMGHDGTAPQRLDPGTKSDGDTEPSWDPSGTRVAFVRERAQNKDIFVMAFDGRQVTQLTDHPSGEASPAWSPDGRQIAFVRRVDRLQQIFVMSSNGRDARPVVKQGWSPAWSPDGARLAFVSLPEDGRAPELYVVELSTGNVSRLTNNQEFWVADPAWSPDGSRIALSVSNARGNSEIYVIDRGGENPRRLTREPTLDVAPSWSPDSRRIVFTSGSALKVVDVSTGTTTRLVADTQGTRADPAWSPDGRRIAFASPREERC